MNLPHYGSRTINNLMARVAKYVLAIVIVAGLYLEARPAKPQDGERDEIASHFRFSKATLPVLPNSTATVREVNPSLSNLRSWISAVGAAAALYDIDGDGLPNDACYVDTGSNSVIVAPVPGSGQRYSPFVLDPSPLFYDSTMAPMGCLPAHITESAQADLLVYYWGRSPILFLRKQGGHLGRDSFVARELVPGRPRWYTNAALFADLTGSGHSDLVIANYFPDAARILDPKATNRESMQAGMPRAENGGGKHFFLWQGAKLGADPDVNLKEVDVALDAQTAHSWTLALGAADLNGDQLPELYFANDFGPDALLVNESDRNSLRFVRVHGRGSITTPRSYVLGNDSFKGMGIDFGDIQHSGRLAMFVSNITEPFGLQEANFLWLPNGSAWDMKQRIAPYDNRSEDYGVAHSGWSWDAKMADFDNDGHLEIVQATGFLYGKTNRWPELQELAMANDEVLSNSSFWPRFHPGDALSQNDHNAFFARSSNGTYCDIADALHLEPTNRHYVSRGIAVADTDGKGSLSFLVANQWAPSLFYHNEGNRSLNQYLELFLRYSLEKGASFKILPGTPMATSPSRPALNATAIVHLGSQEILQQVDGGNGHGGKRSAEVHFGLGPISPTIAIPVEIRWRQGVIHTENVFLKPGTYTVDIPLEEGPHASK